MCEREGRKNNQGSGCVDVCSVIRRLTFNVSLLESNSSHGVGDTETLSWSPALWNHTRLCLTFPCKSRGCCLGCFCVEKKSFGVRFLHPAATHTDWKFNPPPKKKSKAFVWKYQSKSVCIHQWFLNSEELYFFSNLKKNTNTCLVY